MGEFDRYRGGSEKMYPSTYFGIFPPFPRDDRGFVAMSFDRQFDARWTNVIDPAIRAVSIGMDGPPLQPHRVDLRVVSDSILTEILDGIGRCRVFVADITSIGSIDGRAVRNANVLYEVGLAHAVRLPEEVILFRSDEQPLDFDITNVRVHRYDPDGSPEFARQLVTTTIFQSLREVDQKKSLMVRLAAETLDFDSWRLLLETYDTRIIRPPRHNSTGEVLDGIPVTRAIERLLEVGALRTVMGKEMRREVLGKPLEELVVYRITEMGDALAKYGRQQMGLSVPAPGDLAKVWKEWTSKRKRS
jgi:hypothetical protein